MKGNSIAFALLFIFMMSAYGKNPKNIIFLIGDGMGLPQVTAAMHKNGNRLNMERCPYVGLSKTYSFDNYVTDSGAGGTALACGVKTRNAMIGMGHDSVAVESILEVAERNGLATGIVVSCEVTYVTPACFIAHQPNRGMYEECAADFLKTDIDVFIGGGRQRFEDRADGRNLIQELEQKGYKIASTIDECKQIKEGKLAGFLTDSTWEPDPHGTSLPAMPQRGNILPEATMAAIDILDNNKKGFFLMVEGSQIDWGGHANDIENVINETLDFDEVVGRVLDYAEKDGNTLVVITADHETGGLALLKNKQSPMDYTPKFSTGSHTGCMVPVYAYGPGAEKFIGIMENTSFKEKMQNLLKIK